MAEPSTSPPPRGSASSTLPSSFDSNPDFFEEKRLAKLTRRLREDPLIPLGCAATVYALYQASKSIRAGDHHQTNRMFRARIYAQGFTLVALVGGSIFWKDNRMKRKELEKVVEEKKKAEKREKWLSELEERDREDREWRERFEGVAQRAKQAEEGAKARMKQGEKKVGEGVEPVVAEVKEGAKHRRKGTKRTKVMMEEVEEEAKQGMANMKGPDAIVEKVQDSVKQGKENMKQAIEKAFQNKSVLEQVHRSGWGRGMWSIREVWRRR